MPYLFIGWLAPFMKANSDWQICPKNISSDDGYYTLDVRSTASAGTWTIQSASISPLHGIQKAIPQDIVRTKTFDANFHGMPKVTIIVNFLIT